jgi:hypothetical protein
MNARSILAQTAAAAGMLLACAPAEAAVRVVDLDGLRGRDVDVVAGARLADAGAVIAATVGRRGGSRAALVRLRHDGSVIDVFGRGGVAFAGPVGGRALAVTSDAAGRRIVVALRGPRGHLRLIGVDARGGRRAAFGRRGAVVLRGAFELRLARAAARPWRSAPGAVDGAYRREPATALAAGRTRVAVAYGSALAVLDARTGRTLAAATAPGCLTPRTAQLAEGRLIVAGNDGACGGGAMAVYDAATLAPDGAAAVGDQRALALALPGDASVCVAGQAGASVRTRRADPARLLDQDAVAGAPALAAPDRLTGLAPDPRGGCNLLLARPGSGGRIVQAGRDGAPEKITALPHAFRPRVVFVCRSHVLTAGVRHSGGRLVGALAVVERHAHG